MDPGQIRQIVRTLREWGYAISDSDCQDLVDEFNSEKFKEQIKKDSIGPFSRDSLTSKQAALENMPRSGTQRARVFHAIGKHDGMTRDELANRLRLPDSSTDARVWELKRGGWIADSTKNRMTENGRLASVLILTPKGREAWRELHG